MSDSVWVTETIRELGAGKGSTVQTGPFGSQLHAEDYVEEGVPFLLIRNIGDAGLKLDNLPRISFSDAKRLARYSLSPGDIVFTRVGRAGSCLLVTDKETGWIISGQTLRLRLDNPQLDSRFLLYALRSHTVQKFVSNSSVGTTRESLNTKILQSIPVLHPRYVEQKRIAEILSTVDEVIEQTEALIAKYQQIKAGLMHDLFTRGVTSDGHLRPTYKQAPQLYKNSPLGWIPKEWGHFIIGELFTRRAERGRPGLPIMSITMSGGLVERDSVDRRVESNLLPEDHLLVRRGDIAYNMMRMWQGVLGRAEYDCLVSPAYIVMKPGPNIESVFAEYLLSTENSIAWFKRLSYGVVDDRLRLYFRDLVRIRLGIPRSLPEQQAISKRLQLIDSSLQQTAIYLTKLRQQKQGLMQDLLTGRVHVKVGVN